MPILSIPSPNTDRSLLTITELRAAAGVEDGSKDVSLTMMGNFLSAVIAKQCNVATSGVIPPTLRSESVSETFRLKSHQTYLALVRKYVSAISSVTENGTTLDPSTYEEDSGLLYKLSSAGRRIHWHHNAIIVVVYTAGFATVPDDLKYAATRFVQIELQRTIRDPLLAYKSIDGVSEYRWNAASSDSIIPPEVMDILLAGGYVRQFGWMT